MQTHPKIEFEINTIKSKKYMTPVASSKGIDSIVFNTLCCGSLHAFQFSFGKGISLMSFLCSVMVFIKESLCKIKTCGV